MTTRTPDAAPPIDTPPGVTAVDVPAGDITADTTWTADNMYILKGYVFVTGGTLTIEPGTVIKGDERQRADDHQGREARRGRHRRRADRVHLGRRDAGVG